MVSQALNGSTVALSRGRLGEGTVAVNVALFLATSKCSPVSCHFMGAQLWSKIPSMGV